MGEAENNFKFSVKSVWFSESDALTLPHQKRKGQTEKQKLGFQLIIRNIFYLHGNAAALVKGRGTPEGETQDLPIPSAA